MKRLTLFLLLTSIVFANFVWEDSGIKVRQGVHIEWQRTASVGLENETIFIWSDTRHGGRDIYAQKVDASGNTLWTEDGAPIALSEGRQEDPLAVPDGQGGVYIIWKDYRTEPEKGDVYAQHVLSDGSLAWDEDGVPLSNVTGAQDGLNLCVDGLGGAFAIWVDHSETSGVYGQVYATHISFDGEILAPGVGIPVVTNVGGHAPISLEYGGDGFAVMVWGDTRIAEEFDLYMQRMDVTCAPLWSTQSEGGIPLSNILGVDEIAPKVTHVSGDTMVVVWEDFRVNSTSGDVYIQYVDGDGNLLLDPSGVPLCDNLSKQSKPRVKSDAESAYVVWTDFRNHPDWGDIYLQRFTLENGAEWQDDGIPVCTSIRKQRQPRLTTDGLGGAYVVWMDERYAPHPEGDVFLQHYGSDGTQSFTENGLSISEGDNLQEGPIVRKDQQGGAFVIWSDWRIGSPGLYVQHVTPEEGISFEVNGVEKYFGIDGDANLPKTLYLEDDKALIYWEDMRLGGENPTIFGQIVSKEFNQTGVYNGVPLCENPKQGKPNAVRVGDHIFLNFLSENEWGTILQYYQILDLDLNPVGDPNGTPIFPNEWSNQEYSEITVDDQGFIYFAFSDVRETWDQDIYVQKYDEFGTPQWQEGGVLVYEFPDYDYIDAIEPIPGGGCVILWYGGVWDNLNIYAKALNGEGTVAEGWSENPLVVCGADGHQETVESISTSNGVFVLWKEARNANADIFGQLIGFDGTVYGATDGFPIVEKVNDQLNPDIIMSSEGNEVFVCWEDYQSGSDFDIFSTTVSIPSLDVSEEFAFVEIPRNQQSPSIEVDNDMYIAIWQDSPDSSSADIYLQTWNGNEFGYGEEGLSVCDVSFNQLWPTITQLSESDNTFLLVWEDNRSSGKNQLKNIYAQVIDFSVNALDDTQPLPNQMMLNPNYPNPFNPMTTISYELEKRSHVELTIYDIRGRTVKTLVNGEMESGFHRTLWNATDTHGKQVSSGIYLYKLTVDEKSMVRKMGLVR